MKFYNRFLIAIKYLQLLHKENIVSEPGMILESEELLLISKSTTLLPFDECVLYFRRVVWQILVVFEQFSFATPLD